jgi:hypothetical protein
MTWRHDFVLKHIAGYLKSALESLGTVEVYCNLEGLQAPGGGLIPASVITQTQRPDLVILDRSVHGRHRISLVELTCPWDTDAGKARDSKISRYAGLKEELSNHGWDCGLFAIEVGARGHISMVVKDRLRSLFWSWVPPGHRSGVTQMIKYASWISLVCSFSIFQARSNPVWITPSLVNYHIDGCRQISELGELRYSPFPPPPEKNPKKTKGAGVFYFWTHCLSHLLAVWFD